MRLPKGRTAKLAVLLAIVATIAQAQVTVRSGFAGLISEGSNIWSVMSGTSAQELRVYKSDSGANDAYYTIDHKTISSTVYYGMRTAGSGAISLPVGVGAGQKALTGGAATNVVAIGISSNVSCGGGVIYSVFATDGTDFQQRTGRLTFQLVNKAGTETCAVSGPAGNANPTELQDGSSIAQSSASTMTYAWAVDTTGASQCMLTLNAVSGLVETTFLVKYRMETLEQGSAGNCSFTPQ